MWDRCLAMNTVVSRKHQNENKYEEKTELISKPKGNHNKKPIRKKYIDENYYETLSVRSEDTTQSKPTHPHHC